MVSASTLYHPDGSWQVTSPDKCTHCGMPKYPFGQFSRAMDSIYSCHHSNKGNHSIIFIIAFPIIFSPSLGCQQNLRERRWPPNKLETHHFLRGLEVTAGELIAFGHYEPHNTLTSRCSAALITDYYHSSFPDSFKDRPLLLPLNYWYLVSWKSELWK